MTTLTALHAIRELLTPPQAWTQGAIARDAAGNAVLSNSPDAVCWCLRGAISKVVPSKSEEWFRVTTVIEQTHGYSLLVLWNDRPGRTHADILALLDRAIAQESANAR